MEVVIGELAPNVARHARGGNYYVSFELHEDKATVTDNGIGFEPDAMPESGTLRADELFEDGEPRIGGFGLPFVYSLVDHIRFERNFPTSTVIQAQKKGESVV